MGTSLSFPVQIGLLSVDPSYSSAINSTLMIMWNGLSPEDEHIAFLCFWWNKFFFGSPSNCMTKESGLPLCLPKERLWLWGHSFCLTFLVPSIISSRVDKVYFPQGRQCIFQEDCWFRGFLLLLSTIDLADQRGCRDSFSRVGSRPALRRGKDH